MPNFQYIARTSTGEEVAGVMQADSELAVARTLDDRRLFPVSVSEQTQQASPGRRARRVRGRDLALVYGQLADLLSAGVPLLRAIETLAKSANNPKLSELLTEVRNDVADGRMLADAMAGRSGVFNPLHVAMVRAGERAGFLEEVLTNLSGFLERQDELRSKVRGAMVYPLVLTVVGAVLVGAMLVFLVPRIMPLMVGIDLPLPTRVLFAASDVLRNRFWLLMGFVALGVMAARQALRSQSGRQMWEKWRLKLPVIGMVLRSVAVARFCRILGTMMHNGVPILQALAISRDAVGSELMAQGVDQAAESVKAGEPLAAPLGRGGYFSPEVIEMITVAEESNMLEKVLVQIADTVERRTNRAVDQATRLVEPLILLMLAVCIGFIAVGMLYPIVMMSTAIK